MGKISRQQSLRNEVAEKVQNIKKSNTKTHKEFRSNLAREMRDKINERNEQLRKIDGLSVPEEVKEKKANEIKEVFNKEIEEMRADPQYDDALQATRNVWMMKWKVRKSESKVNAMQKELEASQSEEKIKELEEELEKENENLKELREWYLDAQLNLWEEPGALIDSGLIEDKNGKETGIYEIRRVNIDWVEFKYKITKRYWIVNNSKVLVVDDCIVFGSHEINDPKTIMKFIAKIVSYYPEFLMVRGKISYFLEWLAHNCMYELNYKIENTKHVDLDIYEKRRRFLYTLVWICYWLFWPKKNKKIA